MKNLTSIVSKKSKPNQIIKDRFSGFNAKMKAFRSISFTLDSYTGIVRDAAAVLHPRCRASGRTARKLKEAYHSGIRENTRSVQLFTQFVAFTLSAELRK